MLEFEFSDTPDQKVAIKLESQRVSFRFRKNRTLDRVTMDVSIDGAPVLQGRKLIAGTNLLKVLSQTYGLGLLFIYSPKNLIPTLDNLVSGQAKLYYMTLEEFNAAVA